MQVRTALPATIVAIGSLMQGWDFGAMSGADPHLEKEFQLESNPSLEGLVVAMTLIGASMITMISGILSDWLGRRAVLILSSIFFFLGGLLMLWSPSIYVLMVARLVDGFGIGLAVNNVPIYISETSPSAIRGLLSTISQFMFTGGILLSYCMIFVLNSSPIPNWRFMVGSVFALALIYFALLVFCTPESPRWLVSKGRFEDAKLHLQRLRGTLDVTGEMALLVEGLNIAGKTLAADFVVSVTSNMPGEKPNNNGSILLYGPEEGRSLVALPAPGPSFLENAMDRASRQPSLLTDPVVTLFGSVHDNHMENMTAISSSYPAFFGSSSAVADDPWYGSNPQRRLVSSDEEATMDYDLEVPLLSQPSNFDVTNDNEPNSLPGYNSMTPIKQGNLNISELAHSVDIGGGWLLAWLPAKDAEGQTANELNKVYLRGDVIAGSQQRSLASLSKIGTFLDGELLRAKALVSKSALDINEIMGHVSLEPANFRVAETAKEQPKWRDIMEPGVTRALLAGMSLQIIQQFSGVPSFIKYSPKILKQAGILAHFPDIGLNPNSVVIFISAIATLFMLPAIVVAMRLMDVSGRRGLLLSTLPVMVFSFLTMITASTLLAGTSAYVFLFFIGLVTSLCAYSMGIGPISGLFCSEIFPTRVRALCITICLLTYWFAQVFITLLIPVILNTIGVVGLLVMSAVVCSVAFVYIFLKLPETKGLPIEVIVEIFKYGTQKQAML